MYLHVTYNEGTVKYEKKNNNILLKENEDRFRTIKIFFIPFLFKYYLITFYYFYFHWYFFLFVLSSFNYV